MACPNGFFLCRLGRGTVRPRAFADERVGGQIEDQTAIHFWIDGEVELVERLAEIGGLLQLVAERKKRGPKLRGKAAGA